MRRRRQQHPDAVRAIAVTQLTFLYLEMHNPRLDCHQSRVGNCDSVSGGDLRTGQGFEPLLEPVRAEAIRVDDNRSVAADH